MCCGAISTGKKWPVYLMVTLTLLCTLFLIVTSILVLAKVVFIRAILQICASCMSVLFHVLLLLAISRNYAYRQTLNFVVLYVLPVTYLTGNQIFEIISDAMELSYIHSHTHGYYSSTNYSDAIHIYAVAITISCLIVVISITSIAVLTPLS
ncbi:hypothetical protein L596_009838 [Steinernema carpocapsae]|uniref:Uncharacterized protein n=1 Tax=Steinernema carpocapsae TaxID=34508 RepID=A0A4U5PH11_STECR|nr:hypothetical protein L596_009838 [Steinernema carpocapsae]